ncbi:IclR family transcriptional regulator C-terminal domain-containing protein [Microbacterium sp. ARD32]|uniref:IclR family transcriptional regulator domain-containing protein n=1 Tax=Microbacterium sp. ARD32 TaxID=2962577 RepID=UPI002882CACB|nr:IclR family transcriptional regulator C-terminal domain-containing protein [Microbacterium sp. ARD32]MDT0157945.1 IclR family transcriptional regulator C-terminal domain-containing protein [Microbacterium sp. ARD32]
MLYIVRIYGTRRVPEASRVGGRLPLHATAVGKMLLAFEEPWCGRDSSRRFATTLDEMRVGATSIAVPILQHGVVSSALGLVTTTDGAATIERHLPDMRGIARRIEASVGSLSLNALRQVASSGQK